MVKQRIRQPDLIRRFLKHASSSPHNIAVQTTTTSLTYQQLHLDVCHWKALFERQLQGPVIVCLDRTPRLVAILLALQWLNIPYIPVAIATPIERLRLMINDSHAQALLYDTDHQYADLPCLVLNLATATVPDHKPLPQSPPSPLAYIIYTSGSTGTPKGVAISRQALNHFLSCMSTYFLNERKAILLAITTITFDIAALELYLPLWQNKTIFLCNQQEHDDPVYLAQLLETYPITLLQATPTMWTMLKSENWSRKPKLTALCGGERLSEALAQDLLPKVGVLWNMYGPTEATIWCALKHIKAHTPITVGRPIRGMRMFVMNDALQILPPYVKGNLFISGPGLADGYINNPTLTKSQFITHPKRPKTRLYHTGDIACRTPTGEFMIFGRRDNQIKLHGHRIELEEIEANIQRDERVEACAVALHGSHLIAYLCLRKNTVCSKTTLRRALATYLPDYMLPEDMVRLKSLPLTSSGKVDRGALPPPNTQSKHDYKASPTLTPMEITLMALWREVLDCAMLNPDDNFFDLGGHSLLAAQLESRIAHCLKKQILLQDIYHAKTLTQLAKLLEKAPDYQPPVVESSNAARTWLPLTDFQLIFWFSKLFEPKIKSLNVAARKRLQGPINQAALSLALQLVYAKHDAFSYMPLRFLPIQKRRRKRQPAWQITSLQTADPLTIETQLNTSFDALYHYTGWRKRKAKLIARCFYLKEDQIELQISMPHIIADDTSTELFFHDLSEAYLYHTQHRPKAPTHDVQAYMTYAFRQDAQMNQHAVKDAHFWKHYLKEVTLFRPPPSYIITQAHPFSFSTYISVPDNFFIQLRQLCEQSHCTESEVLCAAAALSLNRMADHKHTAPQTILMNIIRSTRTERDLSNTIGCFLQNQLIKLAIKQRQSLIELIKQVQQSALETKAYQHSMSLIKLGAIGRLPHKKNTLQSWLSALGLRLLSSISTWVHLNPTMLNACQTLSTFERDKHFFVNLNIFNNFLSQTMQNQALFNLPCQPIPLHPYDQSSLSHQVEICFLRASDEKPYLVISSNLTPDYRQQIGMALLGMLN